MAQGENMVNAKSDGMATVESAGARPDVTFPVNTPPAGRKSRVPRRVVLPLLAIVVLAVAFFGYRYMVDQSTYVSTDNAMVTGALIQVGSLNAGQVSSVAVDIGDKVTKGQVVATVVLPTSLGATTGGTPKMGFTGTDDQEVPVRSSIDGVVVARLADPGDTIAVGQPLLTVVDPTQFWVQAQIDETKIGRVKPGQPVEITFDTLGRQLQGRVVAIDQATAGTFSLLPQANTSGNYNKVTQLVPVKIAIDSSQLPLVLGSSVEVKIRVQG